MIQIYSHTSKVVIHFLELLEHIEDKNGFYGLKEQEIGESYTWQRNGHYFIDNLLFLNQTQICTTVSILTN